MNPWPTLRSGTCVSCVVDLCKPIGGNLWEWGVPFAGLSEGTTPEFLLLRPSGGSGIGVQGRGLRD